MRLAFIDFIYHYDASRPDADAPLGGTTSAICFLAREMVKAGIGCTFFNRLTEPRTTHGIPSLPLPMLGDEMTKEDFDAYIFCGRWTVDLVALVRANTKKPLIAWMHESAFMSPMTPALDMFDGVVFVSEWQKRINQNNIPHHWQQAVIRNAANPLVAQAFPAHSPITTQKIKPPILLFAGSFVRGAFHIPPILDIIRKRRNDFSVEMFCNLDPSRDAEKDAAYIAWLRGLPNITHIGMVGQPELAQRMRRASIFLAPNPWPETSCIALMEALASGLTAITTNRAALPETASGYARLVETEDADEQTRFDMLINYEKFADQILQTLDENPTETETRLRAQITHFHKYFQWSQRVADWHSFIASLTKN